ncbi:transcription factor SPEECHLESS-like [Wolffia australiana]
MDSDQRLAEIFDSTNNLFGMLESLDNESSTILSPLEEVLSPRVSVKELESPQYRKRKMIEECPAIETHSQVGGPVRMSHITVERNRRKQMNEHLSALKSLMPCFYLKREDQASIIGGVVEYIKELQQVLQSLEAKKRRKVCSEVLIPRIVSSPKRPPLSPKVGPCISPRTPQPDSPYEPWGSPPYLSPVITPMLEPSAGHSGAADLSASSSSLIANVEVKVLGPNVVLKTTSPPIPRQVLRVVSVLDRLALEILQVEINTVEERVLSSFTIKVGIECELSAEDLANQVQLSFS